MNLPEKPKNRGRIHEKVKFGAQEIPIRIESSGVFYCELGTFYYRSESLAQVRDALRAELKSKAALDWKPILHVQLSLEDPRVNYLDHSTEIMCYIERTLIAWDGRQWIECPWSVRPPGSWICSPHNPSNEEQCAMDSQTLAWRRIQESKPWWSVAAKEVSPIFPVIEPESLGKIGYTVPYNETTWNTMLGFISKMKELRAQIHNLMSTSEGWSKLAAISRGNLLAQSSETQTALE